MTRETIAELELSPFEMTSWQNGWAGYPENLYSRAATEVGGLLAGGGHGRVITASDGKKWENLDVSKIGDSRVQVTGEVVSKETVPTNDAPDTMEPEPEPEPPAPDPAPEPEPPEPTTSEPAQPPDPPEPSSPSEPTVPTDSGSEGDSSKRTVGSDAPDQRSPTDSPASPSSGPADQPTTGSDRSATGDSSRSSLSRRTVLLAAGAGAVIYGVTQR